MSPATHQHLIEIDLKEIELVFMQAHTRMTIVAQLVSLSVTLAAGLAGAVVTIGAAKVPLFLYVLAPIPFLVFALLTLREDFLMATADEYVYAVRGRLLGTLGLPVDHKSLQFLPEMKANRVVGKLNFATLQSGLRYILPGLTVLSSLVLFLLHSTVSLTLEGFLNVCFFVVDVVLSVLLIWGIFQLGHLHNRNERQLEKSAA